MGGVEADIRNWMELNRDTSTNAFVGISELHNRIHQGKVYSVEVGTTTVAGSATMHFYLRTPATTTTGEVHLKGVYVYANTAHAKFELIEGITSGASFTNTLTAQNRNRNSSESSTVLCYATTTGYSAASNEVTLETTHFGGGGRVGAVVAGADVDDNEYVLLANTQYEFLVTEQNNSAGAMSMRITWYEES